MNRKIVSILFALVIVMVPFLDSIIFTRPIETESVNKVIRISCIVIGLLLSVNGLVSSPDREK